MNKKTTPQDASTYFESWGLLMRARRVLYKLREKDMRKRKLGIRPEEAGILWVCIKDENASPATIARSYLREPHTVWVQIQVMLKKGLVTLEQNPKWKNRLIVHATDKGRELYAKSLDYEFFEKLYSPLNDQEIAQLDRLLEKICTPNTEWLYNF